MRLPSGLLLVGSGGHCRSVIDVLECAGVPVAGVVCGEHCAPEPVFTYPVLGKDPDLGALRERYNEALVTVGQIQTPAIRKSLFTLLTELEFSLPVVVSPTAMVSRRSEMLAGTVVMHQAFVNTNALVGRNCIINTRALVEHDCTIGDHCHVAVGAVLCGGASIGPGSFIGAGAVVREGVSIGPGCIIGMGSVVRHDVAEGERHVG